jgi:hypothetical protein
MRDYRYDHVHLRSRDPETRCCMPPDNSPGAMKADGRS